MIIKGRTAFEKKTKCRRSIPVKFFWGSKNLLPLLEREVNDLEQKGGRIK